MWAEPVRDTVGWGKILRNKEMFHTFGPDVLSPFLAKHDMDLVVRSNQVVTKDCNKMSVLMCIEPILWDLPLEIL